MQDQIIVNMGAKFVKKIDDHVDTKIHVMRQRLIKKEANERALQAEIDAK